MRRHKLLAAFAALSLGLAAGCADKKTATDLEPAADPGDLGAVEIESSAEASERANADISVDNWDAELEKLELEIDDDPYTVDDP
jgi:hypothetical protein